jgi:hypothetical protein
MNDQATLRQFDAAVGALNAEQWNAWRLGERESDAATLDAPATLDDAVRQALTSLCLHRGDTLAVLYTHAGRNKRTLWLYAIKQSTKRYHWRAATDGGRQVKVYALEPVLICETAMASFEPVLRFDAFRDDAVGRDLTLVER